MWLLRYIIPIIVLTSLSLGWLFTSAQVAPSFDQHFGQYLISGEPDEFGRVETVFWICVDRNLTLRQNVQNLFYPNPINPSICSSSRWGLFWDVFRRLGVSLLFIFFVLSGVKILLYANNEEKRKAAIMSMIYILYGWFLFLWSTWILWDVLNIGNLQWSEQFVERIEFNLFLQILTVLKWFAFFLAIIMLVWYGYKLIAATDQEDRLKNAKKWLLNIVIAMIFIKVIDYVYYIASVPTFASDAANFIVQVATLLGYIIWSVLVLLVFYLWFLLLTGRGEEETVTKAKNIITTIVLSAIVIFLFLLIIYQIFQEIA